MDTLIDSLIVNAEKLGKLSGTAVWAFFTLLLIAYIIWEMKAKKSSSEQAWAARTKEAEADGMMANAVSKLADQIKEIRIKLKCIGGEDD